MVESIHIIDPSQKFFRKKNGDPQTMNQPNDLNQSLSRRQLLKALAASGGAMAVSAFLPARWLKPQVGAGVLPAHAQSTLTCVTLQFLDEYPCGQPGNTIPCGGFAWIGVFAFQPAGYTPLGIASFTACGQNVTGDVYYDAQTQPNRVYVRYNIPVGIPPNGCSDTVLILLFSGGCTGTYIRNTRPASPDSGLLR
jgi:hypothetical protein